MARNKEFDYEQKLDVAMNLFWEHGYHATSISDLEKHMKINRSSIYPTYGDKKELLLKCLDKYLKMKVSEYKSILKDASLNSGEALQKLLRLAIDQSINEERTCLAIKIVFEMYQSDERILTLLAHNEKMIEEIYFKILTRGQEQNEFNAALDPKITAAFYCASSSALLKSFALNNDKHTIYSMVDMLVQMVAA